MALRTSASPCKATKVLPSKPTASRSGAFTTRYSLPRLDFLCCAQVAGVIPPATSRPGYRASERTRLIGGFPARAECGQSAHLAPGPAPARPTPPRYPVTAALRGAKRTRLLKCAIAADCERAVVVMTQVPRLRRTVHE